MCSSNLTLQSLRRKLSNLEGFFVNLQLLPLCSGWYLYPTENLPSPRRRRRLVALSPPVLIVIPPPRPRIQRPAQVRRPVDSFMPAELVEAARNKAKSDASLAQFGCRFGGLGFRAGDEGEARARSRRRRR